MSEDNLYGLAAAFGNGVDQERAAIVKWLRDEAKVCDCFARSQDECVCGAWDDDKTVRIGPIIDAIERGDHQPNHP